MKHRWFVSMLALALVVPVAAAAKTAPASKSSKAAWHMNATIIEACSCPMFCQCYFATKPAAHAAAAEKGHEGHDHGGGSEHFCRANNVFRVNQGHIGTTKLDGAKFWAAMDLGDDFSDGVMKWAVVHFDPSVTKEQREGITTVLAHLYPVKWEEPLQIGADLPIEWSHDGDMAIAKLDGGKGGEVRLNGGNVLRNKSEPVVLRNLKYWGASRHDGFVLMPNEVEAYRLGGDAFEYKGTNGFMITFDIDANDVAAGGGGH